MSYVDRIPKEQLEQYKVVTDWRDYFNNKISGEYRFEDFHYSVEKLIIKSDLFFFSNTEFSISFYDCYFTHATILGESNLNSVFFSNCCFDEVFYTSNVLRIKEYLTFSNVRFGREFKMLGGVVNRIDISVAECKSFDFVLGDFSGCHIGFTVQAKIESLRLRANNVKGDFDVTGAGNTIDILHLEGRADNLSIQIDNLNLNVIKINNFRNEGRLKFSNIRPSNSEQVYVEIKDSYLGPTEFYEFDFGKYDIINIVNAHLTDCTFINSVFKENISSFISYSELDENYFFRLRENYRQLKYALGKQGDIINEQKFHTFEMRAHYKSLDWGTDFWNKIIILLSYYTSNFGQSIWWPIRALLVGHYWMYMLAIGAQAVQLNNYKVSWFNDYIYNYLYLINPLHKTEDLPKDWTIIIDIFMRIWSSYMIYNIIRASRRFIK